MRRGWIVTALLVAVGAGIGVAVWGIGMAVWGVGGLLAGGAIGYLAGRLADLRARLHELEQAQHEIRQIALSKPPPRPPDTVPRTEESPPAPPDRLPPPGPAQPLEPFPWAEPAVASGEPARPDPDRAGPPPADEPARAEPPQPEPSQPEPEPREGAAAGVGEARARGPVAPVDAVAAYRPPADPLTKLAAAVKTWLTTGNAPVKVGAVVLLVGLGLLIREAGRRGIFTLTIEARLIAVAVIALILLATGWRQRRRRPIYGLSLQGVAIAGLYLTTYAAFQVYGLVPVAAAAAAVIVTTVGAGALAVTQDARILAVLGIIGGFLAPVLSSSRPDDYVWVFSFYVVLSLAIAGVAWFRTWPSLNLLGLAFNFGIAMFWLLARFEKEGWPTLLPFIAAFVLIYTALPVLSAVREPPSIRGLRTAPLVFGTPFLGLVLARLVVGHTARGVAASALVLLGLHAVLHTVARRLGPESRELAAAYAGLSTVFAAIAVPLWLDAYFMAIAWAAQGAVVLWFGCRRSLRLVIGGGAVLQLLATAAFATHLARTLPYPDGRLVILNEYLAAAVLLAATALASGWLLHRAAPRLNVGPWASGAALAWGAGWWLAGGLIEIVYQAPSWQLPASFVFVVASCGLALWGADRARWPQLGMLGLGVAPVLVLVVIAWLQQVAWFAHEPFLHRPGAAAVVAVSGLVSGLLVRRWSVRAKVGSGFSWFAMAWGAGWWLAGGLLEISHRLPSWQLPMALGFVVTSLGAAAWAAGRARWPQLNVLGVLILPTLAVCLGLSIVEVSHPLGRYGWVAWPVALAVYYWFLRIRDDVLGVLLAALHAGGFWVVAALIGAEVHWQVGRVAGGVWTPVAALGAVLVLVAGALGARRWSAWPCGPHKRVYVTGGTGPVLIVSATVLFVMQLLLDGDPAPFRFLPVFNPLEMLAAPLLAVALAWRRAAAAEGDHALRPLVDGRWARTLAPAGVVAATMSVARTVHHWRDVPWEPGALARSTELQAALSITWATIALSMMVVAVRLNRRAVWMAGASFMGLVVAKLFFVDLSSLGATTRVVSFLGVGALLVVVGYFAPVVPAATVEETGDRTGPVRSGHDHHHR